MNIELFTLCDGAYNYNGKLTIVGTITTINTDTLPTFAKLGLAMRLKVEPEDVGEKIMLINFYAPDGNKLPIDLMVNLEIKPTPDPISYITFAAELQGLPLEKEGSYNVSVSIEDNRIGLYSFNVVSRNK